MVRIRMTTLRRAKNGDWFARKRIPEDIRSAYQRSHGKGHTEERFRRSASLAQGTAMQEFRDWDAEVSSRIERLRANERGEGEPSLTPRQAHALAGAWYSWFIAQHEEDPGTVDEWGIVADAQIGERRRPGRETRWRQWTICETHYATNERASPIYASGSKTTNIFASAWCLRLAFWT